MRPEEADAKLIFGEALSLTAPAEREAYLDRACGGNTALRQEVESLLSAYTQAGDFLGQTRQIPAADFVIERTGTMIGRYKLLEKIGEGGFGAVWMAEQEEPVRRRVALKIIKLGMDTREVVARFEAERQALAMMDHPNIARVFDGGATDAGRPFFVMELVKGVPITDYCDANKLPTEGRLELFMQVCQAVQHAHQKGVIHRDLKPSNILVTVQDDRAVPKVIDFGVAKATQALLTEKTVFTRFHQWLGTPAYMSPEQAGLGNLDVDTRSDVYSLGVLVYELLTGRTPFDTQQLLAAGYDVVMRTIREEEPPKPSNRLSTLSEQDLQTVARQRQAEPPDLLHMVRGDLDWIVMKALDKDRSRRYETVGSLAADLRHYLDVEPVEARPPGTLYRLGKMVRRHRAKFVAGAAVALSLVIGLTLSAVLFFQERAATRKSLEQKRRADEQAAIAASVNSFLQRDLLAHGNPEAFSEETPEPDLKVRTVLDRASEKIEGQFPRQTLVEAGLRMTLQEAYHGLGEYGIQERHARRAFDIYREQSGPTNSETLLAACALADAERHLGRTDAAVKLLQQTLETSQRVLGAFHTNTVFATRVLAAALADNGQTNAAIDLLQNAMKLAGAGPQGEPASLANTLAVLQFRQRKWPDAIASARRALELERKRSPTNSIGIARAMGLLAGTLAKAGKPAEAEPLAREAFESLRRKLGPEHVNVLETLHNLAWCVLELNRPAEAEPLFREMVARQSKLKGETNAAVAGALYHLAVTLDRQGKLKEAEEVFRRDLALIKQRNGPEAEATLSAGRNLASVLGEQQKYAEAEDLLRGIVEIERRQNGPEHTNTLRTLGMLAAQCAGQGKMDEATKLLTDTLEVQRRVLGPEHPDTLWTMFQRTSVYARQGKWDEVNALLGELLPVQSRVLGPEHPHTLATATCQAWGYLEQHRPEKAEPLLKGLLEVCLKVYGSDDARTRQTMQGLAKAFQHRNELVKAGQVYQELLTVQRRVLGPDNQDTLSTLFGLAQVLEAQGKLAEVEAARREALAIQRKLHGNESIEVSGSLNNLALVLKEQGRLVEAEEMFREAAAMSQKVQPFHPLGAIQRRNLRALYAAPQDLVEAEPSPGDSRAEAEPSWTTASPIDLVGFPAGIAAVVNEHVILSSEVQRKVSPGKELLRRSNTSNPDVLEKRLRERELRAVERLIEDELILSEALKAGCEISEKHLDYYIQDVIGTQYFGDSNLFVKVLAGRGTTLEELRQQHRRDDLIAAAALGKLAAVAPPTLQQIEEYYRSHEKDFWVDESVKLSLITINKNRTNGAAALELQRKLVAEIRARVAEGEDFAKFAQLYGQDSLASKGGDWGWVERKVLRQELAEVAFVLKPGGLSEVIETEQSLCLLQVTGHRPGFVKDPAEVCPEIFKTLQTQARRKTLQQWLQKLRSEAFLRYGGWGWTSRSQDQVVKIEIRHIGVATVGDEEIRSQLRVKESERVTQASVDHDLRALHGTGRFYKILVGAETMPGGLKLIYYVQENPVLTDIQCTGNKKLSSRDLLHNLASKTGDRWDERKLFTDSQEIQAQYQAAGYSRPTVKYVNDIDKRAGRASVTFKITEALE